MPFSLNSEPVKYALIALTSPLWVPFVKALIKEFNDSLRDEGGLFGRAPSKERLAEIEKQQGKFRSPLVSELKPASERAGAAPARRAGAAARPVHRGFGPRRS